MRTWHTCVIFQLTGVLLVITGFSHGQTVNLDSPPAVERGSNAVFTCTATGGTSRIFSWTDVSENDNIFVGGGNAYPPDAIKYDNFNVSEAGDTSIMTIWNTQIEDEGRYRCSILQSSSERELTVEVPYTLELSVASPLVSGMTYDATCEALNGRPDLSITWMLGNSGSPCTPVETPLTADEQGLFSKSSECTFQADSANNEETLKCIIDGHQVDRLNGENTTTLNITSAPRTGIMTVRFQPQDSNLRVSCVIADEDQPNPSITNYSIYRNDTFLIHQSNKGVNFVNVTRPNFATDFRCEAGNYLGSIISEETYDPSSAPASTGIMTVVFQFQDPNPRVSCDIAAADQPNPNIMNYYIISNDTLIHQSTMGVNYADVEVPIFITDFLCVAGNYLGNTTSPVATYDPNILTKPEPITSEGTTSEPRSEEPSPDLCTCDGLSSGASAGIAILAILLAGSVIISVIQFIVWRRHTTKSDKNGSQKVTSSDVRGGSNEANDNMAYEMIQRGDRAYTALKISSSGTSRSATIDPENVTFFTRLGSIGRGDFGAFWKGELRSNQGLAAVAIRQIPDRVSKSTNMLQSVKVLCELSDQPNVVKCIGFCQEQSSIIYEFISGGTLLTHLQMTGVQSQPTYSNLKPNRVRIDEGSLLNFAWQIATGMQFLASKKIIHGTLCAHNVLLGDRKQCKLSDYGLASSLFSNRGKPTRWSSPETMVTGVQSTEGDIWSFGIVLWEIVTLGARPYPNMTFDTVQKEVSNGYKMPRPRHCGQELYTIMSGCWETEGRNRIRFDEILKTLERILEKTHDYLSLSDLDKDLYASPLDV